jgi:hypothetical protein
MAATTSWVSYENEPSFGVLQEDLPFVSLDLTNDIKVVGLKFHGSEIDYVDIFLQDKFADIYYSDATPNEYSVDLTSKSISLEIAKFWTKNVYVMATSSDALSATYDNGTSGVGATLTNSGTQAALEIDGIKLSINDIVFIKYLSSTNSAHYGIYTVTNLGSDTTDWVLTRTEDTDSGKELLDMVVVVTVGTSYAGNNWKIDNTSITVGTTGLTFTQITSTASLESNLTWTELIAESGGSMVRFSVNKTSDDRTLRLDRKFEAYSYKMALRLTTSLANFQVRNWKLNTEFKTIVPETSSRPVKIFSSPDFPVLRQTMTVEYYQPTTTSDNVTYTTGKTWTSVDKIEVFKQPIGGVITPVSSNTYVANGTLGTISFLVAQLSTDVITVTVSKPLTTEQTTTPI